MFFRIYYRFSLQRDDALCIHRTYNTFNPHTSAAIASHISTFHILTPTIGVSDISIHKTEAKVDLVYTFFFIFITKSYTENEMCGLASELIRVLKQTVYIQGEAYKTMPLIKKVSSQKHNKKNIYK